MNSLELSIQNAIISEGAQAEANKAYLEFIKANFFIPVEMEMREGEPIVLYLHENDETFLPVFTSMPYFDAWAQDIREHIQVLTLSGVDLLKGIGDNISIGLNPGSQPSKVFNPLEIARLRSMVLKLFNKP